MRPWLLSVTKSVEIVNVRLNFMYYGLTLMTLAFAVMAFIEEKQFSRRISVETQAFITHKPGNYSKLLGLNPTASELCPHLREVTNRNGSLYACSTCYSAAESRPCYQVSSTCLPMCDWDEDGKDRISCVSPMTFAHSRSSQEVALWTARHVLRNAGSNLSVATSLGPSTIGAEFRFTYKFQLQQAVPPLTQFFTGDVNYVGDDSAARTVVVGSKGSPAKTFSPESPVILTLQEVLECVPNLPEHLGDISSAVVPWNVFRDGIELSLLVVCYNDDVEIERLSLRLGATYAEPVCLLSFSYVRCCTDFKSWQAGPDNSIAVDRAVVLRARSGSSVMWFPDVSSAVVGITSAFVLLSFPKKVMRWFALNCLGHLSSMYRRVLMQSFDLAQQTATMAVLLMSSSVNFLELSDINSAQTGHPAISRDRMLERLQQALQQRHYVLDDSELSAFVDCCFKNMQAQSPWHQFQEVMPWKAATETEDNEYRICDIDTFNVHCSYDSAVDLDTAVKLFDGDRKRGFMERFFTPRSVQAALAEVRKSRDCADTLVTPEDVEDDLVTPKVVIFRKGSTGSLEERRKSVEAQQRRHERELKTLKEKIEELEKSVSAHASLLHSERESKQAMEHFEERLTQLEQMTVTSARHAARSKRWGKPKPLEPALPACIDDSLLVDAGPVPLAASPLTNSRHAMECMEGCLKQLEQTIESSETQKQSLWTAVHQALESMGERIQKIDLQFKECRASVLVLSQDNPGPTFHAVRVSVPTVHSPDKLRKLKSEPDMLHKHSENWEHHLVLMQAQLQQHQTDIAEFVEKRISTAEARFKAVEPETEQRLKRLEGVFLEHQSRPLLGV